MRDTLQGLTVLSAPVEAATVHGWDLRHFGYGVPRPQDGWFDWTALTGQAGTLGTYDATMPHLVVDEGQDLSPGFYRLVRIAAVSVTVFADECQRLTETNSTLNEITADLGRFTGRVEIARNHRNSREITSLANTSAQTAPDPKSPFAAGRCPWSATIPTPRTWPTTSPVWRPGIRGTVSVSSSAPCAWLPT
ncbi:hypothetical protein [Streptomyces sp. NPDC044948]|uniref:hypothetical protein n=1 Tax=Streptomyces sp. NPDC044948 TaxID=3157092 RepID=UPI0033E0BCEE